ncbi:MAG: peptide chain release factor N(5)-glutamine methyltransferase [Candidatus Marinimicrobia bacterium]|jgi:release factor glutamine methyltransferase|nr:peptide chain release factor N(5)-glutamine methyltransferase [Candidatus Neomarinimicrobiota bacterium]MBT3936851.1 peptide chain release factor N(5)-glutamine methyltransferase [Candidatus Neomarinimicrobiota bacterium]MBT3961954.1 peptide chain release factor N(5)-glutamine methyltransferase [Candidatus Neomarinimicrobiota bacterium]MBT4383644.1 peptide chain release factor N(5)-glutamine methyltransferase [Candidatus Neomarinimicrobiota bacterium]MBT4635807.1 peptide chain release factor
MSLSAQDKTKTWRVIDLIHWAETYFREKKFSTPRSEIEWLLQSLLNCSRMDVYLRFEETLSKSQLSILRGWVKRRISHEPLQYITGSTEFYGRTFFVTPSVLIPRAETERLIDISLEKIPEIEKMNIIDIGTGSGCIAITVAMERPNTQVIGIDISKDALQIADKNKNYHTVKNVQFEQDDILLNKPIQEPAHLIICNPPYIRQEEMDSLMEDVKQFEPHEALTDNQDGLTFYRRLAEKSHEWILPGGWLILEVGLNDHPIKAMNLFKDQGFKNVELMKDYNGDDRILIVKIA